MSLANLLLFQPAAGGTIYTRTLSDSITVVDAPIRGAQDFRRIAEPGLTVLDSLIQTQVHGRIAHDDVAVSESIWRSANLYRRLLDSADVTDAVIVTLTIGSYQIIQRVLQDSLDIRDVCGRAAQLFRLTHDDVDAIDAVSRGANLARWATDTLVVAEGVARGLIASRRTTDIAEASDLAARYTLLFRILGDSVEATDSISAQIVYYQQFIGFVLMALETREFVDMRLVAAQPVEMGTERLEHIVLEVTDQ